MALDRTTIRMFGGMGLVLGIAAVLVFLYAMILPSEADLERAAERIEIERRPRAQRDPYFAWPQVTRWHYVTHLPIAGQVNRYRWRAQGEFACSLDRYRERMVNLRLDTRDADDPDTPNADDPIELVSPLAIFDKRTRTLSSEVATRVTFSWGTVESVKMRLLLDTMNAFFDEDVVVFVYDTGPGGPFEAAAGDGAAGGGEAAGSGEPAGSSATATGDEAATGGGPAAGEGEAGAGGGNNDEGEDEPEPRKKRPLRITADHFEIRTAEDTGIFSGNVVARDEGGTILADKMIVTYYSDEEEKADPSRTGMKHVQCIGSVWIDQGTEQAKCEEADFDVATNTVTLRSTETTRVEYRKEQGEDKHQVLADMVIMDRNPDGQKTRFVGNVEATDFSETRESFFGMGQEEEENEEENGGAGTTSTDDEQ